MPELPDLTVYIEALERHARGRRLERIRLVSPFVLRSVDPQPAELEGRRVTALRRLGKRIVFDLEDERFAIVHLMIAGRLRWKRKGAPLNRKLVLAAFDFEDGDLHFTEASSKRRAGLWLARGAESLHAHDPGGIEPLEADALVFRAALRRENHTLKRALTDPTLFAGIGNAYSDEILHRAQLSPVQLTLHLDDAECDRLRAATREVLCEWIERLRAAIGEGFPEKVTAFHPEMAVHGRFGQPCPRCGAAVQRITYSENESNYCATCQTGGKLLRDRALSRLLRGDWPRTLNELEERKRAARST